MTDAFAPTHVAFLRAINVGGRRLPMAELIEACAPLGLGEIRTWQATGNLIFASTASAAELETSVPDALRAALGIEVPAVVRTTADVRAVASAHPFSDDDVAATAGRVQILFVRDEPTSAVLDEVLGHATSDDILRWSGRELWWLPRSGVSDTALRVPALERLLGVSTMRTHGAVTGLATKHLTS